MCVFEIYADIRLKDAIVDMLLERRLNDFFYFVCDKYASRTLLQTSREQVSGRKEYGVFRLFVDYDSADELSRVIYEEYEREGVRCYMLEGVKEVP